MNLVFSPLLETQVGSVQYDFLAHWRAPDIRDIKVKHFLGLKRKEGTKVRYRGGFFG